MTGATRMAEPPLAGLVVLDTSRMLPGAILARTLIDLGARLIKVEDPVGGDPLRHTPPLVDGIGAGFCACLRGAESIVLDLRDGAGAATLRRLARHADVVIESFRPGVMAAWGLAPDRLLAANPALVVCSMTGFGDREPWRTRPAHDINFIAATGLLERLRSSALPRVQIADVTAALLAATGILAALLRRQRTGRGCHLDQPLVTGPLPFLLWPLADASAGGLSLTDSLLAGACPAYRTYRCGDGLTLAVGALEPKFWVELVTLLELPELAGDGLDTGEAGAAAARAVERALGSAPRDTWLARAVAAGLPVAPVAALDEVTGGPLLAQTGLLEQTPTPGGTPLSGPGPLVPALGLTPARPAPRLGQDTETVLAAFGAAVREP
ncbi:MAG: CaiB/BaiF CoA transferase family protein [Acidobacteriota bacterium]